MNRSSIIHLATPNQVILPHSPPIELNCQDIMVTRKRWETTTIFLIYISFPLLIHSTTPSHESTRFHRSLKNSHLRVCATRSPLVQDPDLSIVSLGMIEAMVLNTLSSHLEFTYEIIRPKDILSAGLRLKNGSWTGAAGQLQRKEVDMCATTIASSLAKSEIMEFSYPVVYAAAGIIVPFPVENSKNLVDTAAFQVPVWIALGVTFIVIVVTTWRIHLSISSGLTTFRSQNSVGYWILYFTSLWTNQGITLRSTLNSIRILCLASAFGIYIISNYFTAAYTSILSVPNLRPSVNSIEELAKSNTVKTLLVKGSSTEDYLMESTDAALKPIGEQMRKHPERRIVNALSVDDIASVVKEGTALVIIMSTGESLVETSYKINKSCRVTMAEQTFFSRPQVFAFPKHSLIASSINHHLMLMQEAGLIQYAERRSASPFKRCSVSEVKKTKAARITARKLNEIVGAFFFLATGGSLAFICFIVENIVAKLSQKNSRKSRRRIGKE